MASSNTTSMFVFDDKTLLGILDDLFDEIKREYEFVSKAEPLSSPASPDPVTHNSLTCDEAIERIIAEYQKLKLDDNKGESSAGGSTIINNTGDNGMETFVKVQSKLSGVMDAFFEITSSKSYPVTIPKANSTDNPQNGSSDKLSVVSTEGTEDGFESSHDQSEKSTPFLVPVANSTDNPLNGSSDKLSFMSTERTEDGFESSHDQSEKSISFLVPMANSTDHPLNGPLDKFSFMSIQWIEDGLEPSDDQSEQSITSALEHIDVLIRQAEDEIKNLKQLESQTGQILSDTSKRGSSRSSSPFAVNNVLTPRFAATKYALQTHADIIDILEPKQDRNMNGPASLLRKIKIERRTRCVFVENIDYPIETTDVVDHFAPCGTLVCVIVYREQNGYALLEFLDPISAHTALAMDGTLFRGRTINVMTIEPFGQQGIRRNRNGGFRT